MFTLLKRIAVFLFSAVMLLVTACASKSDVAAEATPPAEAITQPTGATNEGEMAPIPPADPLPQEPAVKAEDMQKSKKSKGKKSKSGKKSSTKKANSPE